MIMKKRRGLGEGNEILEVRRENRYPWEKVRGAKKREGKTSRKIPRLGESNFQRETGEPRDLVGGILLSEVLQEEEIHELYGSYRNLQGKRQGAARVTSILLILRVEGKAVRCGGSPR